MMIRAGVIGKMIRKWKLKFNHCYWSVNRNGKTAYETSNTAFIILLQLTVTSGEKAAFIYLNFLSINNFLIFKLLKIIKLRGPNIFEALL